MWIKGYLKNYLKNLGIRYVMFYLDKPIIQIRSFDIFVCDIIVH